MPSSEGDYLYPGERSKAFLMKLAGHLILTSVLRKVALPSPCWDAITKEATSRARPRLQSVPPAIPD